MNVKKIGFRTLQAVMILIWLSASGAFMMAVTDVPEVEYSLKTGKPVAKTYRGQRTLVTPGTYIPARHEKIWIP